MQRGARRGRKKEANPEKSDWASGLLTDQPCPVLLADDERSLRTALSHELEGEYEVIAAPGVEEALEILGRRLDFVAVVSDLVMRGPDDGYVLLEAVRLLMPRCARCSRW
jgi:DNA-binding NtrC family response regulator